MERRQELCQSLKGQCAVLPNLYSLFPDWTPKLHPEYARARDESTDPWIKRVVKNPEIRRKLQEADCTTFAAIMCAKSSFESLCTVAKWFTWRYTELKPYEVFDCGSLTHDPATITRYKHTSIEYFKHVLCHEAEYPDLSEYSEELQNALNCWDEIAEHVRQQYWCRRERTAGVHPVIATIPFVYGFDISGRDLDETNMRLLRKNTSYLVHIKMDKSRTSFR
ncbi:hypothetical protein AtubIFM57258_005761 [Aspergillus tubingensis]|nr:hypothetical protein AtubIFM57258_005761 [Aspergillus tubingensis]